MSHICCLQTSCAIASGQLVVGVVASSSLVGGAHKVLPYKTLRSAYLRKTDALALTLLLSANKRAHAAAAIIGLRNFHANHCPSYISTTIAGRLSGSDVDRPQCAYVAHRLRYTRLSH